MTRHVTLRGEALRARILSVPREDRERWVDELLGIDAPPPDDILPRGSVPYLPCAVDDILAALREAPVRPDDVFVDLGSGLGRVAILAHLLSGARAVGIEIQQHLVESARARCRELGLSEVSFVQTDAANAALEGSVFFLYAPFNGEMLRRVLSNVERVAEKRGIVVCAVDLELSDVPWLRQRARTHLALTLYDSVRTPHAEPKPR